MMRLVDWNDQFDKVEQFFDSHKHLDKNYEKEYKNYNKWLIDSCHQASRKVDYYIKTHNDVLCNFYKKKLLAIKELVIRHKLKSCKKAKMFSEQ